MKIKTAIVTILLLIILGSFGVSAQADITFVNEAKGITNSNYNTFVLTPFSELFGKDTDGQSTLVEGQYGEKSNKAWATFTITDEVRAFRYLVMEVNFAPQSGLEYTVLATGGGTAISPRVTGWRENRWNNIRYVYEFPDEDSENGYVTAYLNSERVIDRITISKAIVNNQIRLAFHGKIGYSRVSVHTADLKIYATDSSVGAQTYTTPEGLRVFSNRIYTKPDTLKKEDVVNSSAVTRVYTDDTFKNTLADEEYLAEGNVVVYETADNMYSYYTVHYEKADGSLIISRTDSANPDSAISIVNADITKSVAVMGRNSEDESMCLTLNEECLSGSAEMVYSLGNAVYPRYLKFGLSICPSEGVSISAETERGEAVAERIYTLDATLTKDRWNYVEFVYDTSNNTTDTYVNGKCTNQGEATLLGTEALYNSFKIMLHIPDDGIVYLDTIEIAVSEKYPSEELKNNMHAAYGIDGYMCGNSVIKDILSTGVVRVYTDDTFTALSQQSQLQMTDCVVCEDSDGRIVYYTVLEEAVYRDMLVEKFPPVIVTGEVSANSKAFSGVIYAACPVSGEKTLIAAKYKNDIMTEVQIGGEVNKMLSVTILPDADTDTVKVFLWDSLDTMVPECENLLLTNMQ